MRDVDIFCLGPNSEQLRCERCKNFTLMDDIHEDGLDSVATSFREKVNIIICGRKVKSTIYTSRTEMTIQIWEKFPETKPDGANIVECNVCYSIAFEINDIDSISSIVIGGMLIDKCYVVPGTRKFYPTIETTMRPV